MGVPLEKHCSMYYVQKPVILIAEPCHFYVCLEEFLQFFSHPVAFRSHLRIERRMPSLLNMSKKQKTAESNK